MTDWDYSDPKRLPFPWFGGKWPIASRVWQALGDVPNYVEFFCGKADVLFARPHPGKVETINDNNGFVTNALRAIRFAPDEVAAYCDQPVVELDLHARHRWLLKQARETDLIERLRADESFYDAKIAGLWIWGACCWIGSGWCDLGREEPSEKVPQIGNAGRGVHSGTFREPSNRIPEVGGWPVRGKGNPRLGKGVHGETFREPGNQIPVLRGGGGSPGYGQGIHSGPFREPSNQLPHIGGGGGKGVGYGIGVHNGVIRSALYDYMRALSVRLRHVRIVCGDWKRLRSYSVLTAHGLTGIFLDPPYLGFEDVYGGNGANVSAEVGEWCREVGNDPLLLIVLAGYEGEHDLPGWTCIPWKARGGYSAQAKGGSKGNEHRERLWLSPACLKDAPSPIQTSLF